MKLSTAPNKIIGVQFRSLYIATGPGPEVDSTSNIIPHEAAFSLVNEEHGLLGSFKLHIGSMLDSEKVRKAVENLINVMEEEALKVIFKDGGSVATEQKEVDNNEPLQF